MLIRLLLKIGLFLGFTIAEPAMFRFDKAPIKTIVYSSSLWLSASPSIDPISEDRLMFQTGYSSIFNKKIDDYWFYPNIDIGVKISKNLCLTTKAYGFSTGKDHPQILGAGMQYYFGTNNDTLDWSTCFQRVDLKGLEHFRLTSITFDIRKWLSFNFMRLRVGAGSNFFKEYSFTENFDSPNRIEGQINFIGLDMMIPLPIFIVGIETRMNLRRSSATIFLQKEIF